MARLLILRPDDGARASALALSALGHEPFVAPIVSCVPTGQTVDAHGARAVIATSARAIRCVPAVHTLVHLPLFAVGATTAMAARTAGFTEVIEGGGESAALVETILASIDPPNRLIYLAGEPRRPIVESALGMAGFEVIAPVIYRMQQAQSLPEGATQALIQGTFDGVLHYSAETAAHFVRLVLGQKLAVEAAGPAHLCLSDAVAREVAALPHSRALIAERPDEAALFALIRALLG